MSRHNAQHLSAKAKQCSKNRADKLFAKLTDKLEVPNLKDNALEPDYELVGRICHHQADLCRVRRKIEQLQKKQSEEPKCNKQN